jgi:hypothetical protein
MGGLLAYIYICVCVSCKAQLSSASSRYTDRLYKVRRSLLLRFSGLATAGIFRPLGFPILFTVVSSSLIARTCCWMGFSGQWATLMKSRFSFSTSLKYWRAKMSHVCLVPRIPQQRLHSDIFASKQAHFSP